MRNRVLCKLIFVLEMLTMVFVCCGKLMWHLGYFQKYKYKIIKTKQLNTRFVFN